MANAALLAELDTAARELELLRATQPSVFFAPNPAQWRAISLPDKLVASGQMGQGKVTEIVWLGANDTGKTRCLAEMISTLMRGPRSPWFRGPFWTGWRRPTRLRAISSITALQEGLVRELRALLADDLAPGFPRQAGRSYPAEWRTRNGSHLDLLTWDQGVVQHAGATIDGLFEDEPGRREVSDEAMARLRLGGPVFRFLTPYDPTLGMSPDLAWILERIVSAEEGRLPSMHVVYSDAWDNCSECEEHGREVVELEGRRYVARGIRPHAVIEDRRRRWADDPYTLKARFYGRIVLELGRVLTEWDPERHVIDQYAPHPSWPRYSHLDHHPTRPDVLVYGVLDPFGVFTVWREIVAEGTPSEVAERIRQLYSTHGNPFTALIDPISNVQSPLGLGSVFQEYAKHGVIFQPAGAEKTEKALGIARVREMLKGVDGRPLLRVHRDCRLTISQASRWMVHPKTFEPSKEHDDTWEGIYRIALRLPPHPGATAVAVSQFQARRSPLVI